jgi:tyrosyl-tRNA synthetase
VKFGIDPTFTDVHLGHAVPIRLLRLFQDCGHLPVLILGDATARLGDPSGRNEQRPPLSAVEVARNAETYLEQIGRILDLDPARCEVRRNSEWFGRMDFFDGLRLASRLTVARLLERDDFQKRIQGGHPLHLHELLYPLMQGWDSVMVRADVELGGNDQLFNLHVGRLLQEREGQPPQVCVTTPLLLGTDGRKMSKTYGNHVPLAAPPGEVYGKVMSLSDEQMPDWFRLATPLDEEEAAGALAGHPRDAKARLALEVTASLYGAAAAAAAAAEFDRRFRDRELPAEIPEVRLPPGDYPLPALLKQAGLAASTSDARRLIAGGGVRLDEQVCTDVQEVVALRSGAGPRLLQAGRRRFARVLAP